FLPDLWIRDERKRRQKKIQKALPDAIDIIAISVEAGLGFDSAVQRVATKTRDNLSVEFERYLLELRVGKAKREALRNIIWRTGVREYVVLDPTGEFVPEQCRAWRLADEGYRPWLPDATGRWQSEQIAVAVGIEDTLPAVYSRDGTRQLREGEIDAELARRDA